MSRVLIENTDLKSIFYWPILGHETAKRYLQSCILHKTISHAYLFCGLEHLGKFLTAQLFAKTLLCENQKDKRPCNACNGCHLNEKLAHPNCPIVSLREGKTQLVIDQVREIQHELSLRSFIHTYKIVIVQDTDLLNEEAANALLKTLEEPSQDTVFILIARDKQKVVPTIASRCQIIQFNSVPQFQIENWLISRGADAKEAKVIARHSAGRPGMASEMLNNNEQLLRREENTATILTVLNGSLVTRFSVIRSLLQQESYSIDSFINDWVMVMRDILILRYSSKNIINVKAIQSLKRISATVSPQKAQFLLAQLLESQRLIRRSINPTLTLENLVLSL